MSFRFHRRRLVVIPLVMLLGSLVACGSDGPDTASRETTPKPSDSSSSSTPDTGADSAPTSSAVPAARLTSEEICTKLDAAALAAATGLPIDTATPDPVFDKCEYTWSRSGGAVGRITILDLTYPVGDPEEAERLFDGLLSEKSKVHTGGAQEPIPVKGNARAVSYGSDDDPSAAVLVGVRIFDVGVSTSISDAAGKQTLPAVVQLIVDKLGG